MTDTSMWFARRIEEVGLNALQTQRQLFYDGWLLRLSPGTAKRARSVSAHFGSSLPLPQKIAHCESVYARCDLPVLFRITPFSEPADLERALIDRGYVAFDTTLVQVAHLDTPPPAFASPEDAEIRAVDVTTFASAVGELRGSDEHQREAHLERLSNTPLISHFVIARASGRIVAAAQLAAEGTIAGVFDVMTAIDVRGQGHATAAVATLLAWAWDHGVRTAYLQVTASNAPALAIYRKFAFETLYTYHYCGRQEALA